MSFSNSSSEDTQICVNPQNTPDVLTDEAAVQESQAAEDPEPEGSKAKTIAAHVATAATAAAAGLGAAAAINHFMGDDDVVDAEVDANSGAGAAAQAAEGSEHTDAAVTATPADAAGNTAVTNDTAAAADVVAEPETPVVAENVTPDEIVDPDSVTLETDTELDAVVNPDEAAVAIIAGDEVDPADIETAEILDFHEITEVYDAEGGVYTAATFTDTQGNDLMMVDVDSDNTFDVIADAGGAVLLDEDGSAISAGGITVGDAEMNIYGNDTYIASSDTDVTSDFGADSLGDDLIS